MSESNQYTDLAQRQVDAMEGYRIMFEARHPKPERQLFAEDNRLVRGTLAVIIIAAVIVSASHTVPLFIQGTGVMVAIAAFIMAECGLVLFEYILSREYVLKHPENASSEKWIRAARGLGFMLLLIANVYYVMKTHGFQHEIFDFVVVIFIGVTAPVFILVCGQALALESVKAQIEQRKLDVEYAAQLLRWNDDFLKWWDARKNKLVQPVNVEREKANSLNSVNEQAAFPVHSVNSLNSAANGYSKNMNSRQVIEQFFVAHPERLQDKLDALIKDIEAESGAKVGRTSIHNVRTEILKGSGQ